MGFPGNLPIHEQCPESPIAECFGRFGSFTLPLKIRFPCNRDSHQPTFAAYEEGFSQRNSTFPKELLASKSEIQNHALQHEHMTLVCSDTRNELLGGSGYESISDEENFARPRFPFTSATARVQRGCINLERESQQLSCEWPAILVEADELAGLEEKAYNSLNHCVLPEERRFLRGGKGCSRFKFSYPNKQDFSWACSSFKDETDNYFEEDIEAPVERDCFEHRAEEDVPQFQGNVLKENAELDNEQGFRKQLVGAASVSELLEDMHKTHPTWGTNSVGDNIKGKTRKKSSSKKTLLYLGDRVLDDEDPPGPIGEICSEDEDTGHGYQKAQIVKGQTMADMFQEAFNTSAEDAADIPRSNKSGYLGRLQKVMQIEKDRHVAYLKQLQTGQTPSESRYIDVKILSRTLEAKLIVCRCLFGECCKVGFENGKPMKKKTVIFSTTVCGHVELEVGNTVRVHLPWKEVEVNGGETIILCTYFSAL